MSTKITGIALEKDGWPKSTIYRFPIGNYEFVVDLRDDCAQELGVLEGDVELWKLRTPVAFPDKTERDRISQTDPVEIELDRIAELMDNGAMLEDYLSGTPKSHVLFVISPALISGPGVKRKLPEQLYESPFEDESAKRRRINEDIENRQLKSLLHAEYIVPSTNAKAPNMAKSSANIRQIRAGRPYGNSGYPVSLYHPVFSDFLKDIHDPNFVPKPDLLQIAKELVSAAADYYSVEDARLAKVTPILGKARIPVSKVEASANVRQKAVKADRVVDTTRAEGKAFRLIVEVKNEIGSDQSDPSIQGALSYSHYWSSPEPFGHACCLPSFILAIAGPWLCVLGGIALDRFTVEHLTDYIFIGGEWDDEPTVQRVATLPLHHDPQRLYPCIRTYKDSTGVAVEFKYLEPLGREFGAKLVFLASIVEHSETSDDQPAQRIVVKFTRRYCIKAHQLLASQGLAPQLRYDGTAERSPDEYAMIIMDYIPDAFSTGLENIPDGVMSDVERAIKLLHAEKIAFGDLRLPNVLAVKKEDETYGGMLVDFDWSGPVGVSRYPASLNGKINWAAGVEAGGFLQIEHDTEILEHLRRLAGGGEDKTAEQTD
ncbi:hypothetical protein FRB99_006033 [Tulasnella sp. 403]|nr:hypothetical protein FRB99_006033 [Tulasnella sp. 403]